jgi:DNA-binding CsgD family transcriptional regulator
MSVVGRSADYRLLAAIADVSDSELTAGLREAVAHQVLVAEPDGLAYRFRHALVHEAVYEDLLPNERVQMHTAVAAHLEQNPMWFDGDSTELASELACHWNAAHDQRKELPAALAAAEAATQKYAYPEALSHYERAVAVWEHLVDGPELAGMSHAQLLRLTADAAQMSGRFDRSVAFIGEALRAVDVDAEPIEAGLAHERLGRYLWQVNRPAEEYLAENYRAVELVPADPPTVERARVLATLGQQLMLAGRNLAAIETCWQAIDVAQQVGARAEEGHARNSLGSALGGIGKYDEGRNELERARDIAVQTRSWSDLARAAVNLSANLQSLGRWTEALDLALDGADVARRHGIERACGTFLRFNAAEAFYELGRWDEMEEQVREAEAIDAEGVDKQRGFLTMADLLAGRGQYDAALEQLDASRAMRGHMDPNPALEHAIVETRIRGWSGDVDGALDIALDVTRQGLSAEALMCGCSSAGPHLMTIAASLADDDKVAPFAEALDGWIDASDLAEEPSSAEVPALRRQLQAELHRDDPERWRAVADEWARGDRLPKLAYARYRQARAHLATGDRDAAEIAIQEADAVATRVGWAWMSEQTKALAQREHLDLGVDIAPPTPADRAGLTAREREVLRLLSAGRTNRQIGEELFISTKTASVHVSNILAKLQVSNRGEAAAAARRLGLDIDAPAAIAG